MTRDKKKNDIRGSGTILRGTIVSTGMKDTVVVAVHRYVKLPKIRKYVRKTKRYSVHAPSDTRGVGDTVSIQSCRPISKTKSFVLLPSL